jgi:hypothetical protein
VENGKRNNVEDLELISKKGSIDFNLKFLQNLLFTAPVQG